MSDDSEMLAIASARGHTGRATQSLHINHLITPKHAQAGKINAWPSLTWFFVAAGAGFCHRLYGRETCAGQLETKDVKTRIVINGACNAGQGLEG